MEHLEPAQMDSVRVLGSSQFGIPMVQRDCVLQEGDVVELII